MHRVAAREDHRSLSNHPAKVDLGPKSATGPRPAERQTLARRVPRVRRGKTPTLPATTTPLDDPPPTGPPPANQRRRITDRDPDQDRDAPDRIPATSAAATHHRLPAKRSANPAAAESPVGRCAPRRRAANSRHRHHEQGKEGETPPLHGLRPADSLWRRRGGGSAGGRERRRRTRARGHRGRGGRNRASRTAISLW